MSGGWRRGAIAAASLALCLAGLGSVTQGVAVPIRARLAQDGLEREFAQRLEAHRAAPVSQARPKLSHPLQAGTVNARLSQSGPVQPRVAEALVVPLPTSGPVARISVARLGARAIVLAGAPTHDQLARGPALLKQGDPANPVTVLAAHRDTHFLFIRDLREGDEIRLQYVNGVEERYRVARLETVRWDRFTYPLDPARPLLALATCYPFGGTEYGGPLRRVAWAERVG